MKEVNKKISCNFCGGVRSGLIERFGCLAVYILSALATFYILGAVWRLFI